MKLHDAVRMFRCLPLLLLPMAMGAQPESPPPLVSAMKVEVARAAQAFARLDPPMYYLGCGVWDTSKLQISASFGALTAERLDRRRVVDLDVRCGSSERDNTHPLPGNTWTFRFSRVQVPLDDDPIPIRMVLWPEIEQAYRQAAERLAQVRALDLTKAALRDKSADFSRADPVRFYGPPLSIELDREAWKRRLAACTAIFKRYPAVYQAEADLNADISRRSFVNSEGTELQYARSSYSIILKVATRSDDGLDLPLYKSYFAWEAGELPSEADLLATATELAETAVRLRSAPLVEPYTGPAILNGEAAAVFMHEVLGHRLEGHRQKDEKESQTFKGMVGKQVMAEFLNVVFDPILRTYKGKVLSGAYPFDEEGVPGRRVICVEGGILKEFLMNRAPIEQFPFSNGHGRAEPGMTTVARQSNMIIEPLSTVPVAELRTRLIAECRRRQKHYGLLFNSVMGGFTMTGRFIPNAFNVTPLVVYRVYADGRPDELVRGVDIIGTPLASLNKIMAAGDDLSVFNGTCGAESGGVPVGAVSPSLLFGELEVQKKQVNRASVPILPPPPAVSAIPEVIHE